MPSANGQDLKTRTGMDTKAVPVNPIKTDLWIWVIPLFLSGLGILAITSISGVSFSDGAMPHASLGLRQAKVLTLSVFGMFCVFLIPASQWKKLTPYIWGISVLLTLCTIVPGLGSNAGGASRWLRLGPIRFQPFEFLAFSFVAHLCNRLTSETLTRGKAFLRMNLILLVSAIPLMLQPDLGGTLLLVALGFGIYIERFGWAWPVLSSILPTGIITFFIWLKPYRMRRIYAFLDPWQDPQDTGFQVIQGLIAFANGGLWGVGVGKGLQKLQYLPAAHTDFIFAAIGEEMGLLGTGLILFLFGAWSLRLFKHYREKMEPFYASLLWGLNLSVMLPVLINVGGVTKLLPLTGMPLPFVSYGGSSLLFMWMRVGIALRAGMINPGGNGELA